MNEPMAETAVLAILPKMTASTSIDLSFRSIEDVVGGYR